MYVSNLRTDIENISHNIIFNAVYEFSFFFLLKSQAQNRVANE